MIDNTMTHGHSSDVLPSRTFTEDRLFHLTIALLLLLFAFIVVFPLRTAGDVTLHIDNGGRILDGQRLYVDFFNFNTPTIDYLNVVPVAVSRLTGLHPILTYHLFVWLGLVGVAGGAGLIFARARAEGRLTGVSPWLIPAAIALSSHIAWMLVTFGQRDHIFILALLIWAILRWYRWEGGRPWPWAALLIGAFAAAGASIKPTFALGFVLVEGFGLVNYRRWRSLFTWEILGASIVLASFGAYFVLQPDILHIYLTDVTPAVSAGYAGYGQSSVASLIFLEPQSVLTMVFVAVLVFTGVRQRTSDRNLFFLLAILGLASMLSFALQTKGWRYHAVPMVCMIFIIGTLLLGFVVSSPRIQRVVERHRIFKTYPLVIVLVGLLCSMFFTQRFVHGEATADVIDMFSRYSQPGDSVIVVDMLVYHSYPTVIQLELKPVGHYPIAYPIAFAYANFDALPDNMYTPNSTLPPLAQSYLDYLMSDIQQYQPHIVVLRRGPISAGSHLIDVAEYVKAHTDIEVLLERDYESEGIVSGYEVYVRKDGA